MRSIMKNLLITFTIIGALAFASGVSAQQETQQPGKGGIELPPQDKDKPVRFLFLYREGSVEPSLLKALVEGAEMTIKDRNFGPHTRMAGGAQQAGIEQMTLEELMGSVTEKLVGNPSSGEAVREIERKNIRVGYRNLKNKDLKYRASGNTLGARLANRAQPPLVRRSK